MRRKRFWYNGEKIPIFFIEGLSHNNFRISAFWSRFRPEYTKLGLHTRTNTSSTPNIGIQTSFQTSGRIFLLRARINSGSCSLPSTKRFFSRTEWPERELTNRLYKTCMVLNACCFYLHAHSFVALRYDLNFISPWLMLPRLVWPFNKWKGPL